MHYLRIGDEIYLICNKQAAMIEFELSSIRLVNLYNITNLQKESTVLSEEIEIENITKYYISIFSYF